MATGSEHIQREPTPTEHARPTGHQQIRNRERRRAREPGPIRKSAHTRGREIRKKRHHQIRNQREQRGNNVDGSDEDHFLNCAPFRTGGPRQTLVIRERVLPVIICRVCPKDSSDICGGSCDPSYLEPYLQRGRAGDGLPAWNFDGRNRRAAPGAGARGGRERISELLDELIEFTRMHFWSEEKLMMRTGFAGLEQHRAEHHRMLAGILQAAHRLQYGEGIQLDALLCGLHRGLLHHIETMDQNCAPWLHEHSLN